MPSQKNYDKARESIFKKSVDSKHATIIKGYDFEQDFNVDKFIDSFYTTGFQATNVGKAIEIIKKMRQDKVTIFFGFTSNMASCGVREIITYLAKHNMIDVMVTTAGGIEEDFIKCLKPFVLGEFNADGVLLREQGINRTGNIFVPNDRYIEFEKVMKPFLKELLDEQKKTGKIINTTEFVRRLGLKADETSYLYWSAKNHIPVLCPALTDGSIGDMIYFFKLENPDFKLDISDDIVTMNELAINAKETGAIIIGGSLPKHHIMNANMFREGTKYTVYINTAEEFDGSNAGAKPEEAASWGKQSAKANSVKVVGDASIIFPLIVLGAFKK